MIAHLTAPLVVSDDAVSIDDNGNLVAMAKVARTGIQDYFGFEIGHPQHTKLRVYRPESEVFDRASFSSYARVPVTQGHPAEPVTPETWHDNAVGEVDGSVIRDGDHVVVPLIVRHADAIAAIKNGSSRELSAGYMTELEVASGFTPDGEPYDAIQRNIRINHIALVPRGRAGSTKIGDQAPKTWGPSPALTQDNQMTKKVLVDGLEVETTDAGATAIQKLTADRDRLTAEREALVSDHAKALAAKDDAIAKRDAELDATKAKILSDADLDKMVERRAALVGTAQRIAPGMTLTGLSDADVRRAVVKQKVGDAAVADKPDAYVEARFDILADELASDADPVRSALRDTPVVSDERSQAFDAMKVSLENAWKGGQQ